MNILCLPVIHAPAACTPLWHAGHGAPLRALLCPLILLLRSLQRERLSQGFAESVLMADDPNNNEKFTNRIK